MTVTTSRSKKTLHAAEQDRPDVAAARAELKAEQLSLRGKRLIFIDETSVTTKMVRHSGRAPRGEHSPDLNPIEMAFSKLKAALRKGAKRTVKELWRLIGKLVKSFTPDQCANYFRHAGYRC